MKKRGFKGDYDDLKPTFRRVFGEIGRVNPSPI